MHDSMRCNQAGAHPHVRLSYRESIRGSFMASISKPSTKGIEWPAQDEALKNLPLYKWKVLQVQNNWQPTKEVFLVKK
ncbi:hypothetical protein BN2476_1250002 [Paraburkholderia piptadeniae]|uniref:Uncharacterized protein n=1 Tax=Paraburkholderia piptadeniae TaxID=1701573 RepID=A0A1N7SW82_9BURK|nr:hypothetical protein BN2476_1250002 [Paraburkholderia piptadeniae]